MWGFESRSLGLGLNFAKFVRVLEFKFSQNCEGVLLGASSVSGVQFTRRIDLGSSILRVGDVRVQLRAPGGTFGGDLHRGNNIRLSF